MKYLSITCGLFGLFILHSCIKEKGSLPMQTHKTNCDSLAVSYSLTIAPIVSSNCAITGCHVSGFGSGNFTSYTGVKAKVENGAFKQRVITLANMPPAGPLSTADQEKIQCWLDAGAPNN